MRQFLPRFPLRQRPGISPNIHLLFHRNDHVDVPLPFASADAFSVDESSIQDEPLDDTFADGLNELFDQFKERPHLMGVAGQNHCPAIDVRTPAPVQQTYPLVAPLAVRFTAFLRAELLIVHRVIVLIKPKDHAAFIGRVVRHEEVRAVADENAFGVKEPIGLKDLLHRAIEPLQPLRGGHILERLAQSVLVAWSGAVITVLLVEPLAGQRPLPGLGIQMLGRQIRWQGRQKPAASHHPLKGQEGVFLVELQAQIGCQNEPAGNFLLFSCAGHSVG